VVLYVCISPSIDLEPSALRSIQHIASLLLLLAFPLVAISGILVSSISLLVRGEPEPLVCRPLLPVFDFCCVRLC
jgi:hypothetical protein